ncbi:glycerol-3-phosphate responsive antiterminator [Alkalicoccobacillus murimartini]|uniref:Glycerol uptake operon antiterminator regulatory protein n=1 Tax=Alkalicoccobacillus murimartini TaxID=171685 RepID=A0ABT9YKG3_9BACI|nr:glycerol-3-phosphate responsive antiterminator [Alkalicoccobacillus murimartini]MDQ0208355.1 glycerol uptake operon antiterminator [Alkalicoccobacillus murimartini]
MFEGQKILPAIKKMKDFEKVLESDYTYIVMLDLHISQLVGVAKYAKEHNKKLLLHADMIQGLKSDKYAAEFLCQNLRPAGLISTRAEVLKTAKKNGLIAVQRLFLLDTIALETSYKLAEKVEPDLIEVLPGVVPELISKVQKATGISVIAGGLIENEQDIKNALDAGAHAITTSRKPLWE